MQPLLQQTSKSFPFKFLLSDAVLGRKINEGNQIIRNRDELFFVDFVAKRLKCCVANEHFSYTFFSPPLVLKNVDPFTVPLNSSRFSCQIASSLASPPSLHDGQPSSSTNQSPDITIKGNYQNSEQATTKICINGRNNQLESREHNNWKY